MSIFNAFAASNKPPQKQQQQQQDQQQQQNEPSKSFSSDFDPTQNLGVEAFLHSKSFADPSLLHPLAGLNKDTLEYLSLEDSALSEVPGGHSIIPSRGLADDLCYGTGATYTSGLAIGGAWGLQEGLRKSAGQPPRLQLNAALNAITRRGPFLGNSAGVVAIVYNLFNAGIGYLRGKHGAANSITAGVLSGMVFKSTRGVRPMMFSGGVVGTVAAAWVIAQKLLHDAPEPELRTELKTL